MLSLLLSSGFSLHWFISFSLPKITQVGHPNDSSTTGRPPMQALEHVGTPRFRTPPALQDLAHPSRPCGPRSRFNPPLAGPSPHQVRTKPKTKHPKFKRSETPALPTNPSVLWAEELNETRDLPFEVRTRCLYAYEDRRYEGAPPCSACRKLSSDGRFFFVQQLALSHPQRDRTFLCGGCGGAGHYDGYCTEGRLLTLGQLYVADLDATVAAFKR